MSFCPECGRESAGKYCAACGSVIPEQQKSPETNGMEEGPDIHSQVEDIRDPSVIPTSVPETTNWEQPPEKHRSRSWFWILSGVFGLLLAGLAFLYFGNFTAPKSMKLVPADTEMVVCVKPNYFQQRNMQSLSDTYMSIPKVKEAYDKALKELKQSDKIDFENDVKPWLGKEAVLAVPKLDDPEKALLMVEYRDKAKAQAIFDRQGKKPGWTGETYQGVNIIKDTDGTEYAMLEGFFAASDDNDLLHKTIDRQKGIIKDNITQDPGYQKVMDGLPGGRGGAFMYIRVSDKIKREMSNSPGFMDLTNQFDYQGIGLSLSFESNGINTSYFLTTSKAPSFYKQRSTARKEMQATLDLLPNDCIGFLHFSNMGDVFQEVLKQSPSELDQEIKTAEKELGINFQQDVLDVLRGDVTLAVMPQHGPFFGEDTAPVSASLVMGTKNQQQAAGTVDKMVSYLKQKGGTKVDQNTTNGFQVYNISQDYGQGSFSAALDKQQLMINSSPELTNLLVNKHDPLGKNDNYKKAFDPFSSSMEPNLYINLSKAFSMFEEQLPTRERASFRQEVSPWLSPLKSLSCASSGWDEKKGTMSGGVFIRIEK